MEHFLRMNAIHSVSYITPERGISIEIYYYEIKKLLIIGHCYKYGPSF